MKKFLERVTEDTLILWTFLLFSMVLVLTVRMMPASLAVTDDWAAHDVQQSIRSQIAPQIDIAHPALPLGSKDRLVEQRLAEEIAQNQAQYDTAVTEKAESYRSFLRYDANGKAYTYLGDYDSYFWLRYARNILRHGTVCDAVVNGACKDTYMIAPQGVNTSLNPSLHVFAIYGLHKLITIFSPDYPLPATSFLVPVIVGVLGCIPAFFIGRRLAGNVGGLFTAIVTSMSPLYLFRSMGSDTDVWNIVVPLFIIWMIMKACDPAGLTRRIMYATLCSALVGLHGAIWEGYWFVYLIILLGLMGHLGVQLMASIVQTRQILNAHTMNAAIILGVFYVGSGVFLSLAGQGHEYFSLPTAILQEGQHLDRAVGPDYWPNVLTTVAELHKGSITDVVRATGFASRQWGPPEGSPWYFFIAFSGLLLMILPRREWRVRHYALFIGGAVLGAYLTHATTLSQWSALGLLALPVGGIVVLYAIEKDSTIDIGPALIMLVWFLAAIYATYSGVRFILLLIPAFGIPLAVGVGRVYEWLSAYVARELPRPRYVSHVLVFAIIAVLLIQPVRAGRGTARSFVPVMDDAWWGGLTKIDHEAARDAIITSWWDFGHWFKYVADRRVSADGTTQDTHIPRWLGLALVTPNEHEAVGTLRMLNCGSDAFPRVEGWDGAYGRVLKKTHDPVVAEQIARGLVAIGDRDTARQYLSARGFTAAEQSAVLSKTHCDPPEDYFITSGDMVGNAGVWAHFGLWNFTRAYVVQHARALPLQEAIADLQGKFGMSAEDAETLYADAKALTTEGAISAFAAPSPQYYTGSWVECRPTTDNETIVCPIGLATGHGGSGDNVLESFTYNISDPHSSEFSVATYENGREVQERGKVKPAKLIVAAAKEMTTYPFNTTSPIAVLYDAVNRRVLLADPALASSMFTQLYFLDGRYSRHFVKFYDRTGITGTRVLIWKVDWNGTDAPLGITTSSTVSSTVSPSASATSAITAQGSAPTPGS